MVFQRPNPGPGAGLLCTGRCITGVYLAAEDLWPDDPHTRFLNVREENHLCGWWHGPVYLQLGGLLLGFAFAASRDSVGLTLFENGAPAPLARPQKGCLARAESCFTRGWANSPVKKAEVFAALPGEDLWVSAPNNGGAALAREEIYMGPVRLTLANGNSLHLWMDDGEDTHIWLAGPGYEAAEDRRHLYGGPL